MQIDALLTELVDRERAFFNEEARRLNEFYPVTQGNAVADRIYQSWYVAYLSAVQTHKLFDDCAQAIKAGDLPKAKGLLNLPAQAPLTGTVEGDKRILSLILLNDYLPSQLLQKICKEQTRPLIQMMLELSQANQTPEANAELDLLATWIATFPHSQPKEDPTAKEPPFFAGLWETGLKIAAGYLIGRYTSNKTVTVDYEPPPAPTEQEIYY